MELLCASVKQSSANELVFDDVERAIGSRLGESVNTIRKLGFTVLAPPERRRSRPTVASGRRPGSRTVLRLIDLECQREADRILVDAHQAGMETADKTEYEDEYEDEYNYSFLSFEHSEEHENELMLASAVL